MTINKDKVVALEYTLTVNGEVIESVKAEKPLRFIFGAGTLLPKFEENVLEKSVGDAFEFRLEAEEAYGEVNKEMIVEIPKSAFEVDGKFDSEMIAVGKVLPMMDGMGNRLNGTVTGLTESGVVMDFNHPLAGQALNFKGKVVEVREATQQELEEGLYGEKRGGCGGCHGGGCGNGGCGGGDCSDGGCGGCGGGDCGGGDCGGSC